MTVLHTGKGMPIVLANGLVLIDWLKGLFLQMDVKNNNNCVFNILKTPIRASRFYQLFLFYHCFMICRYTKCFDRSFNLFSTKLVCKRMLEKKVWHGKKGKTLII